MAQTAENVFRDFVTDGVAASGANKPAKAAIRELIGGLEAAVAAGLSNGGLIYDTKANMDADLAHGANSSAWVIGDSTAANNGIYRKSGASGAGSWTRIADLPYSFIKASNAGDGTANAIIATSSIPVPSVAYGTIILMNVFATNTGAVTVAINGAAAKPLMTNSGAAIAAGYLTAGMLAVFVDTGASYRLLTDVASAAIQSAAEAARDAAAGYAAGLNLPPIAPGDAGRSLYVKEDETGFELADVPPVQAIVSTRTELAALDTVVGTSAYLKEAGREGRFLWVAGDQSAKVTADTLQGLYVPPTSDATGASGCWVRVVANDEYDFRWFGALADNTGGGTGTDNTSLILPALGGIKAHGGNTLVIPPYCRANTRSITPAGNALNMRILDKSGLDFSRPTIPYQMSVIEFQYTDTTAAGHAYNGNTKFLSGYYHVGQAVESLDPPGLPGSKASFVFWSENSADWIMAYDRTTVGEECFSMAMFPLSTGVLTVGGQVSSNPKGWGFNAGLLPAASYRFFQAGLVTDANYLTRGMLNYVEIPSGSTGSFTTYHRKGTSVVTRDVINNDGSREYFALGSGSGIKFTTARAIEASAFNVVSDYRLKYDFEPLVETAASEDQLASLPSNIQTIMKLRPGRYKLHELPADQDCTIGQLAHEAALATPHAVTGEKDGTEAIGTAIQPARIVRDEDGNDVEVDETVFTDITEAAAPEGSTWTKTGERPVYQTFDASKQIHNLIAAVQELTLMNLELRKRVAALEG